ncbi:MAG: FAD-dependent oxidoreductase [Oscillospiraceae bacterium]|nr:FAD-dependent oxidoreductase [Oscillospiraceae bacterium]
MYKIPKALTPVRIGNVLLKNRIVSAPTTMHSLSNGELYPTEDAISFFESRARAGVGMVTVAGLKVGKDVADDGQNTAWDVNQPNHRNKLMELVERVHFYGAKISMELIGIFPEGYTVSDGCSIMGWATGHEITREAMEAFKEEWAQAAADLVDCGFDAILIHAGHSVPLAQFLSPLTNKRTDEYGGSTENRCRYLIEILDAIRARVGKKLLIEVRISGTEFEEGGIDIDEGIRIGELLQDHLDILQVSAGMHNPKWMTWVHPCGFRPPMPNVCVAEAFKKTGKFHVPIVTLGAIDSLESAEQIIADGKADLVTMARSLIADPELIHKGMAGKTEDVTPCIKCMRCHDSTVYGHHFQCAVNPTAGLEASLRKLVQEPGECKKVAIIGGGPAGMKAACVASDRGHQVTLFEATNRLGGMLHYAGYFSFKYPVKDYMNWLIGQVNKRPIDVKLGTKATPETVQGYDAVLVAIGAEPLILPVPGVEQAKVAIETLGHEEELGSSVILIGGGQVGCETALHYAKLGKKVTVMEMQSELAPDASTTGRNELLTEIAAEPNFIPLTGAKCVSLTATSVTYEKDGKQETITADSVVLSAGMKAKTQEADSFIGTALAFAEIGDCVRARTVEYATKEAYYAAVNL